MMRTNLIKTMLLPVIFALAGCATKAGVITSLEDLGTESQKEGAIKIPQYKVASIPGWLPFADVGSLYFYKPSREPSTVIGLSNSKKSYVVTSSIESDCGVDCLAGVKGKVAALSKQAADLIQKKVAHSRALNSNPAPDAIGDLSSAYDAALASFNSAYEDVENEMAKKGVFIYRWSTHGQSSGFLGLGALLGLNASKESSYNGFALVSSLRIKNAYFGCDVLDQWKNLDTKSEYSNRFQMTTYLMQARYISYGVLEDLETQISAHLKASSTQLADLPATLKSLDSIEIKAALSKISNLSNVGTMGDVKRTVTPIKWDDDDWKQRTESSSGWLTFYSVTSQYGDILEMLKVPGDKGYVPLCQ